MTNLCDIETTKTEVFESLSLITSNCFPAGKEEDFKNKLCNLELEHEKDDDYLQIRTIQNTYLSKRRSVSSVRNTIIQITMEFLQQ